MMRGVNLGGWLALEKWITPELFSGTQAQDETYLCAQLGRERAEERLGAFRDTFIQARDFARIAQLGYDAVRIPVPFFVFEDIGPYIKCDRHLENAMKWAEEYGLKVLIDLHTVPGGHNGTDNSGICGVSLWSTREGCMHYTLGVLEEIARRYGGHKALWGIGVLNEPMCSDTPSGQYLSIHNLAQFYAPHDPALAAGNANYTLDFIRDFYREAYARIRRHAGEDKFVVFSDVFELDIWDDFMLDEGMRGVCLDTHQYLMTPDRMLFKEKNLAVYADYINALGRRLRETGRRTPLIVGEWNAQCDADGRDGMTREQQDELYGMICDLFQDAFDACIGWFYWTWKVHARGRDADCDDASRCADRGWLPKGVNRDK